LFKSGSIYA
jgi:isoleucyl-tRNA synthetase